MTESEAIKELHEIRPRGGIIPQKRAEAIDMAIKALEKQIPKKIVKHDKCPVCNNNQSTTWYYVGASYCEYCGQKLDWSDEE